jgi:hypothetical protein
LQESGIATANVVREGNFLAVVAPVASWESTSVGASGIPAGGPCASASFAAGTSEKAPCGASHEEFYRDALTMSETMSERIDVVQQSCWPRDRGPKVCERRERTDRGRISPAVGRLGAAAALATAKLLYVWA